MNEMPVRFLHPRSSSRFEAMVEPHTTREACLQGLISEGFLQPEPADQPYQLVLTRTQCQVPTGSALTAVGVQPNDVLAVVQESQGA